MGLCGLGLWLVLPIFSVILCSSVGEASKVWGTGDAISISGFTSSCEGEGFGLLIVGLRAKISGGGLDGAFTSISATCCLRSSIIGTSEIGRGSLGSALMVTGLAAALGLILGFCISFSECTCDRLRDLSREGL